MKKKRKIYAKHKTEYNKNMCVIVQRVVLSYLTNVKGVLKVLCIDVHSFIIFLLSIGCHIFRLTACFFLNWYFVGLVVRKKPTEKNECESLIITYFYKRKDF